MHGVVPIHGARYDEYANGCLVEGCDGQGRPASPSVAGALCDWSSVPPHDKWLDGRVAVVGHSIARGAAVD